MSEFEGPLGAWANKTLQQRTKLYRHQQKTTYCPDARAATFERVLWLKDENLQCPFRRVLEVGCHDGFATRWLAKSPAMKVVMGVDPCEQAIDNAIDNAPDERFFYDAIGFEECDWAGAEPYDIVVCFEVLEHFLPEECMRLVEWMLWQAEPGARLYFCTPNVDGVFGEENADCCHINLFSAEALGTLLAEVLPDGTKTVCHLMYDGCPHLMVKATLPEGELV